MKRLFLLVVSLLVVGSFNNRTLQIYKEDYLIPKSDTALQPKADFDDNYHNE